jgi:hypothetical protein
MYGANFNPGRPGASGVSGVNLSGGASGAAASGEAPQKFVVKNGIKKINPEYKQWQKAQNENLPLGDADRVPNQMVVYHQPNALAIIQPLKTMRRRSKCLKPSASRFVTLLSR